MTDPGVEHVRVRAYTVPTEAPEADGTLRWDSTTLVLVELTGGGRTGLGYTYADTSTARLIRDRLAALVQDAPASRLPATHAAMVESVRNLGRPGIASMAIAALDTALWDWRARLLGLPLVQLFGAAREAVDVYGSAGFTGLRGDALRADCRRWVEQGIRRIKIKVGRDATEDVERVRTAREAVGRDVELYVDANGGYSRKQALAQAERFAEHGVSWFEEPVSSDDLEGLRLVRDRAPLGMEIAAGEYGYDLTYFRRMLEAGAVDVLMPDATRCGGFTGFLRAGALCDAFGVPLSAHTAPALHVHVCCALPRVRHLEFFHDHVRIERMLFDGAPEPVDGAVRPDLARPGLGLELADAERFEVEI